MIQVQFVLNFQPGENRISLNILEREDANDLERELARYIQELHVSILETLPQSDIETTIITKEE